jgi:hypothetical protein
MMRTKAITCIVAMLLGLCAIAPAVQAADKPNIVVIWGDDIGVHNISAYNHGIMGYRTPNIDRIAKEGALFTDSYAQQSCTAGRASFILGQHPFRTGLLTIGMPGSDHGIPTGRRPLPTCSKSRATPAASSARTTWATATSTCPPTTASTNSSATSTISTPKRSPRPITTPRIPNSAKEVRAPRCPSQLDRRKGGANNQGHRPADPQTHGNR